MNTHCITNNYIINKFLKASNHTYIVKVSLSTLLSFSNYMKNKMFQCVRLLRWGCYRYNPKSSGFIRTLKMKSNMLLQLFPLKLAVYFLQDILLGGNKNQKIIHFYLSLITLSKSYSNFLLILGIIEDVDMRKILLCNIKESESAIDSHFL